MGDLAISDDEFAVLFIKADDLFEHLLRDVICATHKAAEKDQVARALLCFLVRVANSWKSIRTLRENSDDDAIFIVDAGTLLRAMYDAYLQAKYIVHDTTNASDRAVYYFEFEHVERYKWRDKVLEYDNYITRSVKSNPKFLDAKADAKNQYDRVKHRFVTPKGGIRDRWYKGSLASVARSVGVSDEYDFLLKSLHCCVHSSASVVLGKLFLSHESVIGWASSIAARVVRISVDYNQIAITELQTKMLHALTQGLTALKQA